LKKLNQKSVEELSEKILELINSFELTHLEKTYALTTALFSLGVAMYDKPFQSKELVKADFQRSPTFAAGVILTSFMPHALYEIFAAEATDPTSNAKKWDAESIKNFVSLMEKKNASAV
jgi:uncharacterized membrane protein (DUF485 family)